MEIVQHRHQPARVSRASMGPPPFGDGDLFRPAGTSVSRSCFNGATAFRRWRWRSTLLGCPAWISGFNGATAFRRWRYGLPSPVIRFSCRLQWGHRLSAMEMAHIAWSEFSRVELLQWGHRLSAMEIRHAGVGRWRYDASMRPPPFGDGDGRYRTEGSSSPRSFNGATAFRRWRCLQHPLAI